MLTSTPTTIANTIEALESRIEKSLREVRTQHRESASIDFGKAARAIWSNAAAVDAFVLAARGAIAALGAMRLEALDDDQLAKRIAASRHDRFLPAKFHWIASDAPVYPPQWKTARGRETPPDGRRIRGLDGAVNL